jgi:hypothetical protein
LKAVNNPVEINTSNLFGPPTGISTVGRKEDNFNLIPGHSELISSGFFASFLERNSAWHLKPAELTKANKQINKSFMIDPYLYGKLQAGCGPDPDNIDPKALLTHLIEEVPIDHRLDKLVGFLWATSHGYNDSPTILNECEPGDKIGDPARCSAAWSASWINPRTPPADRSKPTKSQEKSSLPLLPMSQISVRPKEAPTPMTDNPDDEKTCLLLEPRPGEQLQSAATKAPRADPEDKSRSSAGSGEVSLNVTFFECVAEVRDSPNS